MTYERFAYLYDELMKDVPYEKWVKLLQRLQNEYQFSGHKILDLACGTGELSVLLAKNGYDVTGVDLSEDMLTVAQNKAEKNGCHVHFFQQDMSRLELIDEYDIIGIFCDSLNYLSTEDEIKATFSRVYRYLKKGGLFLFDVHSVYKMNEIFKNQTFTYDDDHIYYIWDCFEGDAPYSVDHELTFFVEDSMGKFDRIDENHYQRTYPEETYQTWLKEAGFELVEMIGDFEEKIHAQTERVFFALRKS